MKKLTLEQITELQKQYGVTRQQDGINSGDIWKFEGSVGRFADSCLESGICMLSEKTTYDYYGNRFPTRTEVKAGSKGSLENAQEFWQKVVDGDDEAVDYLEQTFLIKIHIFVYKH